ncbi:MAG: hypothetical protein GYB65_08740, partial [Chloroflexi bacterium]|nr:hypothetical protein [Chloroflexota bacterium]
MISKKQLLLMLVLALLLAACGGTEIVDAPTISLQVDGESFEGVLYGYCWPERSDNNVCEPAVGAWEEPSPGARVPRGGELRVVIDGEADPPDTVQVMVLASTGQIQTVLDTAPGDPVLLPVVETDVAQEYAVTFDVTQEADYLVQVTATYDDVEGQAAYLVYVFHIAVSGQAVAQAPDGTGDDDDQDPDRISGTGDDTPQPAGTAADTEAGVTSAGTPTVPTKEVLDGQASTPTLTSSPAQPSATPETPTLTPTLTATFTPTATVPSATPTMTFTYTPTPIPTTPIPTYTPVSPTVAGTRLSPTLRATTPPPTTEETPATEIESVPDSTPVTPDTLASPATTAAPTTRPATNTSTPTVRITISAPTTVVPSPTALPTTPPATLATVSADDDDDDDAVESEAAATGVTPFSPPPTLTPAEPIGTPTFTPFPAPATETPTGPTATATFTPYPQPDSETPTETTGGTEPTPFSPPPTFTPAEPAAPTTAATFAPPPTFTPAGPPPSPTATLPEPEESPAITPTATLSASATPFELRDLLPEEVPELTLVLGGREFTPVGAEYCVIESEPLGILNCITFPVEGTTQRRISLLRGDDAQLVFSERPLGDITIEYLTDQGQPTGTPLEQTGRQRVLFTITP